MLSIVQILNEVCCVCHVTKEEIISKKKSHATNIAKNLYYFIGTELGFHPSVVANTIGRTRPVCIIMAQRCQGYLDVKDKEITPLYELIKLNLTNKTTYTNE